MDVLVKNKWGGKAAFFRVEIPHATKPGKWYVHTLTIHRGKEGTFSGRRCDARTMVERRPKNPQAMIQRYTTPSLNFSDLPDDVQDAMWWAMTEAEQKLVESDTQPSNQHRVKNDNLGTRLLRTYGCAHEE